MLTLDCKGMGKDCLTRRKEKMHLIIGLGKIEILDLGRIGHHQILDIMMGLSMARQELCLIWAQQGTRGYQKNSEKSSTKMIL